MSAASAASDAHSAITVEASRLSDILSAAQKANSQLLVIDSELSDLDSQVLVDSSRISDIASVLSNLDSALGAVKATAGQMTQGTVDETASNASVSAFEASDITEATASHFVGRAVLWTSGDLAGQMTEIGDYELNGGRGKFTVSNMTEAPSAADTFRIV